MRILGNNTTPLRLQAVSSEGYSIGYYCECVCVTSQVASSCRKDVCLIERLGALADFSEWPPIKKVICIPTFTA